VADYLKAPDEEKRNIVSELFWNPSIKDRKIADFFVCAFWDEVGNFLTMNIT
jgi:hypothetical protein